MKAAGYFIFAAVLAGLASAASAKSGDMPAALYQMNSEMEAKLQAHVGDTLLGPGNAFFFLEINGEVKNSEEEESKRGIGELRTETPEAAAGTEAAGAGKEGKKDGKDKRTGSTQTARQAKRSAEEKSSFGFQVWPVKVKVLYNADVPQAKLKAVKEALLALYPGKLKAEDIIFIPAVYAAGPLGKAGSSAE